MNQPFQIPDAMAFEDSRAPATTARNRQLAWLAGSAALAVVALGGWHFVGQHGAAPAAPPPAVVAVAQPLQRQVTQWDDYVGRFAPSRTVEVRPRVSGAIVAIHFRDGDIVKQGQPLFTVDPRPYAAALAEAQADLASARSAQMLAEADYGRVKGLTGDEAISGGEIDALRAKVRATAAGVAAAQARVRARALDMEFTVVRAPVSGRISDRRIDPGNLVTGDGGAGSTLLTTINAVDPIYFDFDASEALYLKAQRDRAAGHPPADVDVQLQDESGYRWHGHLDFTDNGLDPRSGTIRVRATFANPKGFLTPGMFGNLRMTSGGMAPALLVPDAAVMSDQARKIVMVVGRDGMVAAKPVVLGPLVGSLRVIRRGLAPGDAVVLSNAMAAMPGAKVKVRPGQITQDAPPADTAPIADPTAAQATIGR